MMTGVLAYFVVGLFYGVAVGSLYGVDGGPPSSSVTEGDETQSADKNTTSGKLCVA